MIKKIVASSAAVLMLALAVPAFAGGAHCSGGKSAMAWNGACLQRTASGAVSVAEVAAGSPAAKAGLKAGDIVLAVNGKELSGGKCAASCSAGASCAPGSQVTYTVRRDGAKKDLKFTLVPMPEAATQKYASREGAFDATLAAMVLPAAR